MTIFVVSRCVAISSAISAFAVSLRFARLFGYILKLHSLRSDNPDIVCDWIIHRISCAHRKLLYVIVMTIEKTTKVSIWK